VLVLLCFLAPSLAIEIISDPSSASTDSSETALFSVPSVSSIPAGSSSPVASPQVRQAIEQAVTQLASRVTGKTIAIASLLVFVPRQMDRNRSVIDDVFAVHRRKRKGCCRCCCNRHASIRKKGKWLESAASPSAGGRKGIKDNGGNGTEYIGRKERAKAAHRLLHISETKWSDGAIR
jgi:hypothetical protein